MQNTESPRSVDKRFQHAHMPGFCLGMIAFFRALLYNHSIKICSRFEYERSFL